MGTSFVRCDNAALKTMVIRQKRRAEWEGEHVLRGRAPTLLLNTDISPVWASLRVPAPVPLGRKGDKEKGS